LTHLHQVGLASSWAKPLLVFESIDSIDSIDPIDLIDLIVGP